ncbi:FoF1 ATP synthase subunit B' [uncultured Campylobacter sp.]|jgi:ATP synthase subunit B|uniref:FoF1 ATP synthase subunit B' n=1 Tax=uncultured Campylobacter sp. TaxID=218934 RepID=UPI0025D7E403|nr:FoF1 ATP synthase subunit B' [uncultured Campylobacter sp.]
MLEIDVPLVVLTAIVFVILIAILNPLLYKPMLKFIDDRNASIKNDEENTSKNTSDLGLYEAQIEDIILKARSEANKIKQDALNLAKDEAAKEIETKRASLETDYANFINALNVQKGELKSELASKLPQLQSVLSAKLASI